MKSHWTGISPANLMNITGTFKIQRNLYTTYTQREWLLQVKPGMERTPPQSCQQPLEEGRGGGGGGRGGEGMICTLPQNTKPQEKTLLGSPSPWVSISNSFHLVKHPAMCGSVFTAAPAKTSNRHLSFFYRM